MSKEKTKYEGKQNYLIPSLENKSDRPLWILLRQDVKESSISWTAWFLHLHYPWISAQGSFSLWKLLLSKQAQLFFFQIEKGRVLWPKICLPGRHLKSHWVTIDPLAILIITVGMNGFQAVSKYGPLTFISSKDIV